jgi:hypothetical protein
VASVFFLQCSGFFSPTRRYLTAEVSIGAGLVFEQALAERVSVDSEGVGRLREVVAVPTEHIENEALFEFLNRFFKQHALINHLIDQLFQFRSHEFTLG